MLPASTLDAADLFFHVPEKVRLVPDPASEELVRRIDPLAADDFEAWCSRARTIWRDILKMDALDTELWKKGHAYWNVERNRAQLKKAVLLGEWDTMMRMVGV